MIHSETVKLRNLCLIRHPETNKILVEEGFNKWTERTLPCGKVNKGESIVDSVKRVVKEETGLYVDDLRLCGIKQWYDKDEDYRYLVFCFCADTFYGEIKEYDDDRCVYWIDEDKLKDEDPTCEMDFLLDLLENEEYNEMCYVDNGDTRSSFSWDLKLY